MGRCTAAAAMSSRTRSRCHRVRRRDSDLCVDHAALPGGYRRLLRSDAGRRLLRATPTASCRAATTRNVPVNEISLCARCCAASRCSTPRISPCLRGARRRGRTCSWQTYSRTPEDAKHHGAQVLTYHLMLKALEGKGIRSPARCAQDMRTGEDVRVPRWPHVVNAAGRVGRQDRCPGRPEGLTVVPGKGTMVAMNHRLVNTVVNRCRCRPTAISSCRPDARRDRHYRHSLAGP